MHAIDRPFEKKNDLISLPAKYLQEIADQQLRVESTWI